jgi:ribonucrease Y
VPAGREVDVHGIDGALAVAVAILAIALGSMIAMFVRRGHHTPAAEARNLLLAAERDAVIVRQQAEADATALSAQVRKDAEAQVATARDEIRTARDDLARREARLAEREERVDGDRAALRSAESALAQREADLVAGRRELDRALEQLDADRQRLAGVTAEQARAELVASVEADAKRQAALTAREIEAAARTSADDMARRIIATAIGRLAAEQTAASVVSAVHLPGNDMKGRIIGREGRNVRAFEATTGVNLIIDDTPETVLLSCFDPVRRESARIALEDLIADGRIHPQRIEEAYERASADVAGRCDRAGADAALDVGVADLAPELVSTLGRLTYRTSYGQNVLAHLVESAHLARLMADELGIPPAIVVRAALLHDLGKALTHEVEGPHAAVGADLARRHGEHPDVVHAIAAHHNEVEPRTVEAVLVQAADAISGSRPGARRESVAHYLARMEGIETLASAFDGVDKVFAMQSGRDVRVMVLPDQVDDLGAQVLARDIAKRIEADLTYPGQIRVTVVRESRATEFAR